MADLTRQDLVFQTLDILLSAQAGQVPSLRGGTPYTLAPRTRRALVLKALVLLGMSSVGEEALISDFTAVDDLVDGLLAQLLTQQVVSIPNVDAIPGNLFDPLAAVLADSAKSSFSVGAEEGQTLSANAAAGIVQLKQMSRARPDSDRLNDADFKTVNRQVEPVLADLRAREICSIDVVESFEMETVLSLAKVIAASLTRAFSLDPSAAIELKADGASAEAALRLMFRSRATYEPMTTDYF